VECDSNSEQWLKDFNARRNDKKYSLVAYKLNQSYFKANKYDENILINFIINSYEDLENYRYLAIIIEDEIYDKDNNCITWNLLYKSSIFAENFIQFSDKFVPFHKEEQIKTLEHFLKSRKISNSSEIARSFYDTISCGFKFEDCFISDNQYYKILILKKIELNDNKIPCPSCNKTIISGNSYPEMFLKSWECKNPSCPDRSKSGRGKRYDEYGAYRYFKLVEQDKNNIIDNNLYQKFHRDVFSSKNSFNDFLIKEYSYAKENILLINFNSINESYGRIVISTPSTNKPTKYKYILEFEKLPIVILYKQIINNISLSTGEKVLKKGIEIINSNSTDYLQKLLPSQIGTSITSPPYYNAREYSQWDNLLLYLCDMIINIKSVYNTISKGGYYLYNIGDIVAEDNIYVKSHMSNHRISLGFLSSLIFELAGFKLTGNIIWDKGEVQSKRNSTINLFSGYVKCINCYEHLLVFRKGEFEKLSNSVEQINPVIKINCKGENIYKHTAPYPEELVDLVKPYINKDLYLLDPYLGSGTTLKWCLKNKFKGIGIELNKEYYQLSKNNIK
jgi:DNA modification methylase